MWMANTAIQQTKKKQCDKDKWWGQVVRVWVITTRAWDMSCLEPSMFFFNSFLNSINDYLLTGRLCILCGLCQHPILLMTIYLQVGYMYYTVYANTQHPPTQVARVQVTTTRAWDTTCLKPSMFFFNSFLNSINDHLLTGRLCILCGLCQHPVPTHTSKTQTKRRYWILF